MLLFISLFKGLDFFYTFDKKEKFDKYISTYSLLGAFRNSFQKTSFKNNILK